MRGTRWIVGVLAVALISLGVGGVASAATLKANYQLQGGLASEVAGAPDLINLGAGNRFAFETVDGVKRSVLTFPKGNGLALDTTGLVNPNSHSVVLLFRLADTRGYRRILDFSNSTADNGFYNFNGKAVIYGGGAISRRIVFDESYAQVVLTNAPTSAGPQGVTAYVNGSQVASATVPKDFDLGSGMLRFFQDNTSGPAGGEESAGAVACILVYDGALTLQEVDQLTADPTLCPVPRPGPRRAKAFATKKPKVIELGGRPVVNTGLNVRCPLGTSPCPVRARVDVAGRGAEIASLGKGRFSLPAGAETRILVRLSVRGAKALREAGSLRVKASARISAPGGKGATARQAGRIEALREPAFRTGPYTGTTSQGLPIFIGVGRTGIQSVLFRWRVRCADGKVHTNATSFRGARIRGGRFSFDRDLDTGGSVHMSGRIRGVHASGTLSRTGGSAFGTKCAAKGIRWQARASGIESD